MGESKGYIQIHISGKEGIHELTPANYDIRQLREMLENVEDLLSLDGKNKQRPIVSYEILEGSVIHRFVTTLQMVAQFGAVLSLVSQTNTLDGLDLPTATAFENIQKIAKARNYSFEFSTSLNPSETEPPLTISSYTNFKRSEKLWADGEFYFYGSVINAGGKRMQIYIWTLKV